MRKGSTMAQLEMIIAFTLILAGNSAWSQQPTAPPGDTVHHPPALTPRTQEERDRAYQAAHHTILNVLVTDGSGKPAHGLREKDFTVLDNGQPRPLATFRAVEGSKGIAPTRIILMLDAVNNTPKEIANDRKGVENFLAQSQDAQNPAQLAYPTSIGFLTAAGASVSKASRDRASVQGQLHQLTDTVTPFACAQKGGDEMEEIPIFQGNAGTNITAVDRPVKKTNNCDGDRYRLSVAALKHLVEQQQYEQGRAILVWIGKSWPLLPHNEAKVNSTGLRQNLFDNLAVISNAMREGQVTVDAVFVPDQLRNLEQRSDHDNRFFNGVATENEMTASSLGLQMLAHQSGGLVLIDGKDLAAEIAQCVADAQLYYALSFELPPAGSPGEFHSLEVKTDDPALTVRTNTNYYAEP